MADLIPTGRTSLVKRGAVALQVQTEYAYRPTPRITTTVQKSGQVVQKIERSLEAPISTLEEKNRMETAIRKQHLEIVAIIERNGRVLERQKPSDPIPPPAPPEPVDPKPYPETPPRPPAIERIKGLPGFHRLYRLDTDGNLAEADVSPEFRKAFKPVLKNLRELLSVFAEIPGLADMRESGVYEIERDRLYLISTGLELYVFYLEHADFSIEYEREIASILKKK